MSGPTLGIRGNLVPINPAISPAEYAKMVPIDHIVEWFRSREKSTGVANRVLVLKSETASGKSTLFPPVLTKSAIFATGAHTNVICTQPRIITAIENVNEILSHAVNASLKLGETIGWSTKTKKLRPRGYGLLSATIGTLTQLLKTSSDADVARTYRYILIDETHERDLNTDMTIAMLKQLIIRMSRMVECPFVVLMSATFDPDSFLRYFGVPRETNFIWCKGAAFRIDEMWDWNQGRTVTNFPRAAADIVEQIILQNPNDPPNKGNILIFMPGGSEIEETAKWLDRVNKKLVDERAVPFSPLKIERGAVQSANRDYVWTMYVNADDQEVTVDSTKYTPSRKVIISTNVAETGLTVHGLKYVIDAGYNREVEYNPVIGVRALLTKPAPISRITQRRGRVARHFPGVFYPLYPSYIKERLPELQLPQILVEDISPIAIDIVFDQLRAKAATAGVAIDDDFAATSRRLADSGIVFSLTDIDMLDMPTPDSLDSAFGLLYHLGAIDSRFMITPLGDLIRRMGLPPAISRLVLSSFYWGAAVDDIIAIVTYTRCSTDLAASRVKPMLWDKIYLAAGIDPATRLFVCDDFIDGLVFYIALRKIMSNCPKLSGARRAISEFCELCEISYDGALGFIRIRDEVIEQLMSAGIRVVDTSRSLADAATVDRSEITDVIVRLKLCLYEAFRSNFVELVGEKYYTRAVEVKMPTRLAETEAALRKLTITASAKPRYFVAYELSMKYNKKSGMYPIKPTMISLLDGFVSPDITFGV